MLTLRASTPVKNTSNSATKFAATIQPLPELRNNMDSEMRKNFVGPMPVRTFLDEFLPVKLPRALRTKLPDFASMVEGRSERDMYSVFVSTFPLFYYSYL